MFIIGQAFLSRFAFNYVDFFVVVWIIVGILWGRKRGMSQELLPVIKWIAIVLVAGIYYRPFASVLRQNTSLDTLWSNVCAYVLIGIVIHLLFIWIRKALGEKLVGSDLFGRGEYYLGMVSGAIHFACMVLALMAVMNARIISKEEMAQTEKIQKQNFEGIRFPTYGSIQHAVLFDSYSGRLVKNNLSQILIASTGPDLRAPKETIARKSEESINEIIGSPKK